jgi:hypothetical protein
LLQESKPPLRASLAQSFEILFFCGAAHDSTTRPTPSMAMISTACLARKYDSRRRLAFGKGGYYKTHVGFPCLKK